MSSLYFAIYRWIYSQSFIQILGEILIIAFIGFGAGACIAHLLDKDKENVKGKNHLQCFLLNSYRELKKVTLSAHGFKVNQPCPESPP